ncbi:hypothetical protein [Rhizobium sp. SYY.PMSO]|uniref:hypothetical protein n=1 Tax=Rhizobium sp. SYY.PMSO TaxID=3382192 RepID=UPI00399011DC
MRFSILPAIQTSFVRDFRYARLHRDVLLELVEVRSVAAGETGDVSGIPEQAHDAIASIIGAFLPGMECGKIASSNAGIKQALYRG